ncbi:dihydropyrimidinase [Mycolicibacterium murale]|uniref:Dihydropyrimidinase n=2 Tax=Mycolicibacterium murale TaxID=182220 RepID=A0A7I9WLW4_9MYCO|nr:dihydropyrimidinase [Mycolicibacterium murale]MCV7180409.1 dihydropyrimidinase [Mycolicibacterium murale]GFG58722.1 dihydropyrimidinase [Mycolicibacterium murale]
MPTPCPDTVDLAVRGGTVVNSDWSGRADVLIHNGKIVAVTEPAGTPETLARRTIDASELLLLPGGVDPHCHVGFTSGVFTTRDTYLEASRAAVLGGTTTMIDFAIPVAGQSPWEAIEVRRPLADNALCDSALHACVIDWDDSIPDQLQRAVAAGIVTVKMFTTYRGEVMANEDTILRVMKTLKALGGMAVVHAEANHIVEDTQQECLARQQISAGHHHLTRPELSETASVAEILAIAEALGTSVYFVHLSTPQSVELVAAARMRGVKAYAEAVTHHLTLDDREYAGDHPERFVCCPPLRSRTTVESLRRTVHARMVDTIGSDHCCYDTEQKCSTPHDVRTMPNGLPGVETRLPVIFDQFVGKEGLPVESFVAVTSANPARVNGLYPRKGVIAVGSDADMALWDSKIEKTITSQDLHMTTDYTPYEGRAVVGWPTTIIVGGRVVAQAGAIVDDTPRGRHIHAQPV